MQFGLQLPTYWQNQDAGSVLTAVEESARTAEAVGFDSVWANDHVIAAQEQAAMGHILEPLTTLASVIHLAPRLRLGTSVLVLPQRNAIVVAKQAAALDILSSGRFMLGIGVGWNAPEFQILNAEFTTRGAHADEAIEVMRTLWRNASPSYAGRFYHFSDAVFFPKPPHGGPPLWIGGNTAAAICRAARYGDAWSPYGIGLDAYRAGVAELRSRIQDDMPLLAAHLMLRLGDTGRGHVSGTPAEVARVLSQYQEAGLQYVVCGFEAGDIQDYLRQVHTFAQEVMPRLPT